MFMASWVKLFRGLLIESFPDILRNFLKHTLRHNNIGGSGKKKMTNLVLLIQLIHVLTFEELEAL